MSTSKYHIGGTFCRVHNKKTAALAERLRKYNYTIVEFDEASGFTADVMLQHLQNYVAGLNRNYKGSEITVASTVLDMISFTFYEAANINGDSVATLMLSPVRQVINAEEQL